MFPNRLYGGDMEVASTTSFNCMSLLPISYGYWMGQSSLQKELRIKKKEGSRSFIHLCSRELKRVLGRKAMNNIAEKDTFMVEKVDGAIRQAADKLLERAKQTGTPVVIWEDDQIKEVPPEELELKMPEKTQRDTRAKTVVSKRE